MANKLELTWYGKDEPTLLLTCQSMCTIQITEIWTRRFFCRRFCKT